MTIGTTDGNSVWGFRYSAKASHARCTTPPTCARCGSSTDRPRIQELSDETRIVVSEPLVDLPGAWNEVPESSYGVVQDGEDELHPFRPIFSRNGG